MIQPKTAVRDAEKLREFVEAIWSHCMANPKLGCSECKHEGLIDNCHINCKNIINALTAIIQDLGGDDEQDSRNK